jgi:hypothetical protein
MKTLSGSSSELAVLVYDLVIMLSEAGDQISESTLLSDLNLYKLPSVSLSLMDFLLVRSSLKSVLNLLVIELSSVCMTY